MVLPIALALLQLAVHAAPSLQKPIPAPISVNDGKQAVAPTEAASDSSGTVQNAGQAEVSNAPATDGSSGEAKPAAAASGTSGSTVPDTSAAEDGPGTVVTASADQPSPAAAELASPGAASLVPTSFVLPAAESSSRDLAPVGVLGAAPAAILSNADEAEQAEEQRRWMQKQKRIWLGLSIAQSSAAAFDGWSTRLVVGSGRGYEMNPMLRPFAGNGSLYAAIEVGPVLIDYVARRMLTSHHEWARRTWWIPQVTGTVVSLVSAARNVSVYNGQ